MLENRKFLSIDDGEVISDDLLARSSIGREVRLRMIDVSRTLEKIGFTAIGIAVTLDNSGIHRRGTPGRLSATEAAEALRRYLKTLIEKELRKYPIFVSYVFEAHRGGMPHIHAMIFCLPSHLEKISAFFSRFLSREAVTVDVLSPAYLFKQNTGKWHLEQTTAQILGYDVSKLLRKTTSEWENGKRRVYKCDRIKDLQEGKILHSMQNFKMARKYPNAYVEIDVFMNSLLEQWNATFGAKKDRARASSALKEEAKAPYFLDKTVIFPQSIKKTRRPKKTSKQNNTKPLDLDLRAKNGDRYHASNCRVFLDSKQVKALKLAAKKQRNKNGLICLIRTLFSNYQNGLTPSLSPTRAKAYLNFVYNQHQARQRARQKQARADRKLAREYGADNIQQLYDYHKHRELWGEVRVEVYEKWHTDLWQKGLMSGLHGGACDAIVDELLDTEEYWELGLHEKYQKLGELFPKKRTAVAEKSHGGCRKIAAKNKGKRAAKSRRALLIFARGIDPDGRLKKIATLNDFFGMIFIIKSKTKESIMELNQLQKPSQNQNVALAQTQSQNQPQKTQEQKPQEKKPLSENAKLVQELKKILAKLSSVEKRETAARNTIEKAQKELAAIAAEKAQYEAIAKKFEAPAV